MPLIEICFEHFNLFEVRLYLLSIRLTFFDALDTIQLIGNRLVSVNLIVLNAISSLFIVKYMLVELLGAVIYLASRAIIFYELIKFNFGRLVVFS